jgi:hypothetical protein
VYHEKCNDGIISAYVIANYINTNFDQDKAVYIPANYGKDSFTRTFKENKVFNDFMNEYGKGPVCLIVVDFSFAPADIARTHLFQFGEREMDSLPCIFDLVFFEDAEINDKLKQLNVGEEQRKNFLLFSYILVGKYFIQKKNFPISFLVCIMPEYINFCKRTLELNNYYKNFEFFFANSLDVKIPTKNQIRENIEKIKSYNS